MDVPLRTNTFFLSLSLVTDFKYFQTSTISMTHSYRVDLYQTLHKRRPLSSIKKEQAGRRDGEEMALSIVIST
jgi:hypothetical protein